MVEEKNFDFAVYYNATIVDDVCVTAFSKEEAIQKIKDNSNDVDVYDSHFEYGELIDIEEF